jgi:hypothetical protein
MPRFVIDAVEVSSIRTERDAFFEQKRVEVTNHRGKARHWHLVFIRSVHEELSCRGMTLDMVLDQIDRIEEHFNNGTLSSYYMMCAGLRTVIHNREDSLSPRRLTVYPPRGTCPICRGRGTLYAECMTCGEDSGGRYF